jgi:hypothetical protein
MSWNRDRSGNPSFQLSNARKDTAFSSAWLFLPLTSFSATGKTRFNTQ